MKLLILALSLFSTVALSEMIPGGSGSPASFPSGMIGPNDSSEAGAGEIGEYIESKWTSVAAGSEGWISVDTLTLSAGEWDVTAHSLFNKNGATWSGSGFVVLAVVANGNNQNQNGYNSVGGDGMIPTAYVQAHISIPSIRVRSDGTDLIINSVTYAGTQDVEIRSYHGGFSGGPIQLNGYVRARRVR